MIALAGLVIDAVDDAQRTGTEGVLCGCVGVSAGVRTGLAVGATMPTSSVFPSDTRFTWYSGPW